MRAGVFALFSTVPSTLLLLNGCGYVGPVLPPSPEIPNPVTNLVVVERGDRLLITFDVPPRTTDDLAIRHFSEIDLRIGPTIVPWDFEQWSASATRYQLHVPPPGDPDDPKPIPMEDSIPVSAWLGKHVAVAVRTAIKTNDHYSQWSNRVVLEVIPPLPAPTVQAEATAQGVRLTWPPVADDAHYHIFRRGPNDKTPLDLGTAEKNGYIDTTAHYDTHYEYTVTAEKGAAESPASEPASITPIDVFPPSIPAALTALATPESVELSWQRSPEADLKGYYVYRAVGDGPFLKQGDLVTLPAYSDHNVEHGKTYRYAVTSIDQRNNESNKSAVAEVIF